MTETPTVHHGAMFDTNELVLNMGPQHPSTHGVLRVVLRLDGEKVVDCDVVIGYLHRGIEKLSENRNWTQIVLLTDRMDYVAAATNNVGSLAILNSNSGAVSYRDLDGFAIGTVTAFDAFTPAVSGISNATRNVTLTAGGAVTQAGALDNITASTLASMTSFLKAGSSLRSMIA